MYQQKPTLNQQYKDLQRQLDLQHQRLLQQRQYMLSKQNQRLELYEKIDLVQFFNYEPKSSKEEIMYHLSSKFKNYMRQLTENNTYKKMGHLIINQTDDSVQRSSSLAKKTQSNVQKNSQLGRIFQRMRYHCNQNERFQPDQARYLHTQPTKDLQQQNFYLSQRKSPEYNKKQVQRKLFETQYQEKYYKNSELNDSKYNIRTNQPQRPSSIVLNPQQKQQISQVQLSISQLNCALDQQQKIFILSELNHYIKLYKQAQTKQQFMERHLENLHSYLIDVRARCQERNRLRGQSRSKSKSKHEKSRSTSSLLENQNQLLKRQIQTYKLELKALLKIHNEDYLDQNQSKKENSNLTYQRKKPLEVKKIDRFKQFAEHIILMQRQLSSLVDKVSHFKSLLESNTFSLNPTQTYYQSDQYLRNKEEINRLQFRINQLQITIENEEQKKLQFFEQVKKFKEMMKRKDDQILDLKKQLRHKQNSAYQHNSNNNFQVLDTISDNKYYNYNESKLKYNNLNSEFTGKQNYKICQSEFDRFPTLHLDQSKIQYMNETPLSTRQNFKNNSAYNSTYHSRAKDFYDSQKSANLNSLHPQRENSSSRSKYSSRSRQRRNSRSRSRTDHQQAYNQSDSYKILKDQTSYEPRPYERYNSFYEQDTRSISSSNKTDSLYHRINQTPKNKIINNF